VSVPLLGVVVIMAAVTSSLFIPEDFIDKHDSVSSQRDFKPTHWRSLGDEDDDNMADGSLQNFQGYRFYPNIDNRGSNRFADFGADLGRKFAPASETGPDTNSLKTLRKRWWNTDNSARYRAIANFRGDLGKRFVLQPLEVAAILNHNRIRISEDDDDDSARSMKYNKDGEDSSSSLKYIKNEED